MQPNKKHIKTIALYLFFSAIGSTYAQFNTLTPKVAPEKEYQKFRVVENNELSNSNVSAEKKGSGVWKRLFRSEKAALRKEVDSLKTIIHQSQPTAPNILKQVQDSIILSLAKKAVTESHTKQQDKQEPTPTKEVVRLSLPLKGELHVTSHFGERFHPILKQERMHNGIDLRANYQHIYAVLDGVISAVGWDSKGGGVYIKVKHQNFETTYCHLSEVYYRQGESVKAGFIIGKSGNTGLSTAPHLHFSVKQNNEYINPVTFLNNLISLK